MLGLVLLYWIGKYHYRLAEQYNKNRWGYAILGVVTYYGGIILASFTIGFFAEIFSPGLLDEFNEMLFGLLMLPFGLLSTYFLYRLLENSWKWRKANTPPPIAEPVEIEENSQRLL
jgi:hypothetical protein